jgi:threonyl-tRNA synthetase
VLSTLGMKDYRVRVGLRAADSNKYIGHPADWDKAEAACFDAARTLGVPFTEEPGEAAFYGPKIDFVVKDVIGREWQLGTVQVDYNLPVRFDLTYVGADNKSHRPVMIHRAPFGSMERFTGVIIEHFAGHFPTWLAPEQVRVLTVSEKSDAFAEIVAGEVQAAGLRATWDRHPDKVGAKIRHAQLAKVPYMLVVGEKEAATHSVSVRHSRKGDLGLRTVTEFLNEVIAEVRERRL